MDYEKLETTNITINDKQYTAYILNTEEEKEYGAKGLTELEDNEVLLFNYKNDPQDSLTFWMQDTSIPLDIIFVSEDNLVLDVFKGEPLSEEYLTCEPKDDLIAYVLETNQNSGIKKGDEVEIDGDSSTELEANKMYVLNSDGTVQWELLGSERIFSRKSSRVIIRKAKRAFKSNKDTDYKSLGRYIFQELDAQQKRDPEYVESPS